MLKRWKTIVFLNWIWIFRRGLKLKKAILKIIFGNILLGFAYAKLMVPNKIINGGVTSLSLIFTSFFDIDIVYFTNGLTILLLIISYIFLGKFFLGSSIVSSLSYMFFFSFFHKLPFSMQSVLPIDFLLAVILIAVGYYCCLSENSSTAGLDVFAIILNKKFPKYTVGFYLRCINCFVLLLGVASYGIQSVLLGIVFSILFTKIMDYLMEHYHK
ncbi:TPA: YitT family protein [Streptococcus suis]|nr:YitT family protein [Streptococcus suis]HEM3649037.1 YitT family protein [Streptococcus suis]